MAQSRREINKIKCREKLLKASRRLFKEKGYEDTMIEDVAEKAEVSKATLYNYFPNKESLLLGTMEDEAENFQRYIQEQLKDVGDPDEKMRSALTFLIWDSIPFIGVSRRILFLNACETSHMYGKANPIMDSFRLMAKEAAEQNLFREGVSTEDVVELLMGVYLSSQFQWDDVERLSKQECQEKVKHSLDLALAGVYQDNNRIEKGK